MTTKGFFAQSAGCREEGGKEGVFLSWQLHCWLWQVGCVPALGVPAPAGSLPETASLQVQEVLGALCAFTAHGGQSCLLSLVPENDSLHEGRDQPHPDLCKESLC